MPPPGFDVPGLPLHFAGWKPLDSRPVLCGPAATSWGPDRIDLFSCDHDRRLIHTSWDGAWRGWETLGGAVDGLEHLAAASWGFDRVDCFARGTDTRLWHIAWGGSWERWQDLNRLMGIVPPHVDGLSAIAPAKHHLQCFVNDRSPVPPPFSTLSVYEWFDGAWLDVGGVSPQESSIEMLGSPAVVDLGGGHRRVFARRRQDNHTLTAFWTGEMRDGRPAWRGWFDLEGQANSGPAAVFRPPNQLDVFVRGMDDGLYHNWFNGIDWRGWESLGGVIDSRPTAVSLSADSVQVFARAPDSRLFSITGRVGGQPIPTPPIK